MQNLGSRRSKLYKEAYCSGEQIDCRDRFKTCPYKKVGISRIIKEYCDYQ